jgi:putative RNA 2'-phosphotransferase
MDKQLVRLSKFLSLVLRHQPQTIGLSLDPQGWAQVDELLEKANAHGVSLTLELLREIVEKNDKRRFALSDDGRQIRANQGHSIQVALGLEPLTPPALLYHGTATHFVDSIKQTGLRPGKRQHVHLSTDEETATAVGRRHGKPIVIIIQAGEMCAAGYPFYLSANGVWLTGSVPPEYLIIFATSFGEQPGQS